MSAEVTDGDALLEDVPIMHIESQPQLEPKVFRHEVFQAPNEGLSQAREELGDACDVIVCVYLWTCTACLKALCVFSREKETGLFPFHVVMFSALSPAA